MPSILDSFSILVFAETYLFNVSKERPELCVPKTRFLCIYKTNKIFTFRAHTKQKKDPMRCEKKYNNNNKNNNEEEDKKRAAKNSYW